MGKFGINTGEVSKKRRSLYFYVLIVTIFAINLTGCTLLTDGKPKLYLGCQAICMENSMGPHHYVCENGEKIFYYDNEAIYMNDIDFTDRSASKKVASVSKYETESICCTKDKLYYTTWEGGIHIVDLTDFSEKVILEEETLLDIVTDRDKVYTSYYTGDGYYCISDEDHPVEEEPDFDAVNRVQLVDGKICFKINGKLFLDAPDGGYSFDSGEVKKWSTLDGIDEIDLLSKSKIVRVGTGAYFLAVDGVRGNTPPYPWLRRTALFYLDGETEESTLIYANAPGEQIGAYSVAKKELYVLRNNGIYAIDFSGENERLLYGFELKERSDMETEAFFDGTIRKGTDIVFEECAGRLFVYYKESNMPYLLTIL